MTKYIDEMNYDELVEKSLRNVVYYALKIVEEQGLPGENHFYITFRTDFPGTIISKNLKIQYPESMTIVLQNQFENLVVHHNSFSVDLSFGGVLQTITIPYEAITYFADPYAKFGLSFEPDDYEAATELAEPQANRAAAQIANKAEVISIDNYRRKK
ncbi:MAG: ClpXP protease specificity-enhancing factor SspB [Alphaproteobacteria bacterium]|nr:ClpXP protease specificity-enhancing factor SspB [Alphaproteobacteria bacterium]